MIIKKLNPNKPLTEDGDWRDVKKFAWFPKQIRQMKGSRILYGDWFWWEWYIEQQVFKRRSWESVGIQRYQDAVFEKLSS